MYVINFTIFVCGISEECVSALTNKKRGSQRRHLGMEMNPPICWAHCHSLPFIAIPFKNRLFCPFLAIPCRSSPFYSIKKPGQLLKLISLSEYRKDGMPSSTKSSLSPNRNRKQQSNHDNNESELNKHIHDERWFQSLTKFLFQILCVTYICSKDDIITGRNWLAASPNNNNATVLCPFCPRRPVPFLYCTEYCMVWNQEC